MKAESLLSYCKNELSLSQCNLGPTTGKKVHFENLKITPELTVPDNLSDKNYCIPCSEFNQFVTNLLLIAESLISYYKNKFKLILLQSVSAERKIVHFDSNSRADNPKDKDDYIAYAAFNIHS